MNLETNPLAPENRIKKLFIDVGINPQYPLIRYFRAGPELISMARIYEREGNLERAFILYYRYITLFLEKLPETSQYKDIPAFEKIAVKNVLKEILPKLEHLKSKLYEKYEIDYHRNVEQQKVLEKEIEQNRNTNINLYDDTFNEAQEDNNLDFTYDINTSSTNIPSRDLKPKHLIDSYNSIESGMSKNTKCLNKIQGSLRIVRIPKNIVAIFLSLAESNTDKNIETGGHLFGKLSQNIFTITHLVIPKQSGKSDSFSAINEEEMVYFKESKNLLTLGWIHTHPSQTSFLSSVDLHNQYPNQQLLPEYIAIVCAPTHKETKIFTITPDYGMNILAACREEGFHYHSQNPPLYEECRHVFLESHLDVAVEDMRRI